MSIHCACWNDGIPCCWCLDDTEEGDGVTLPGCANSLDTHDGHTIDVGYTHTLTEPGGPCTDDCPHPEHDPG